MAFIEEEKVIEKILEHLESWEMKARPPSRAKTPSLTTYLDASDSHLPRQHRGLVFAGPLILFGQETWFEKAWKEIGNDGKDCQGLTVQIVNTLQKRRVDDFRKEASKETSDLLGVFGTLKT